jgi:hypothetical protein
VSWLGLPASFGEVGGEGLVVMSDTSFEPVQKMLRLMSEEYAFRTVCDREIYRLLPGDYNARQRREPNRSPLSRLMLFHERAKDYAPLHPVLEVDLCPTWTRQVPLEEGTWDKYQVVFFPKTRSEWALSWQLARLLLRQLNDVDVAPGSEGEWFEACTGNQVTQLAYGMKLP